MSSRTRPRHRFAKISPRRLKWDLKTDQWTQTTSEGHANEHSLPNGDTVVVEDDKRLFLRHDGQLVLIGEGYGISAGSVVAPPA